MSSIKRQIGSHRKLINVVNAIRQGPMEINGHDLLYSQLRPIVCHGSQKPTKVERSIIMTGKENFLLFVGNHLIDSKYPILPSVSDQLHTMGTTECIPAFRTRFRSEKTKVSPASTPSHKHTRAPLPLAVHILPRRTMLDTKSTRPYNYRDYILNFPKFINQCCDQKLVYGNLQDKYDINHDYSTRNNSIVIHDTYTHNTRIQQTKYNNQPYIEKEQQFGKLGSQVLLEPKSKCQDKTVETKEPIRQPNQSSYPSPSLTFHHQLSGDKSFPYNQEYPIPPNQTPERMYDYKPANENEYPSPPVRSHQKRHSFPTYDVTHEHHTSTICHRCHDTSTPQWRRGPNGPNTLCNACGSFYSKLIRQKGVDYANGEIFKYMVVKDKNGRRLTCATKKPGFNNQVSNQTSYPDNLIDKNSSSPISNTSNESLYTLSPEMVRNKPQVYSQPVYWIGD